MFIEGNSMHEKLNSLHYKEGWTFNHCVYDSSLLSVKYYRPTSSQTNIIQSVQNTAKSQLTQTSVLQCVQKKRPECFFVMSSTKLGWFWWYMVHSVLNKFPANMCKRFPPHLNNVSTLPCETWNAHCARATIALLLEEFIPPQMWPPNSPAW